LDVFLAAGFLDVFLTAGLAPAFFTPFLAAGFFKPDFFLEGLVDLAFFLVAVGMLYPVNSKKAVKYGGEAHQSQGAQRTFITFFRFFSSIRRSSGVRVQLSA
jgi:hypothetical protein